MTTTQINNNNRYSEVEEKETNMSQQILSKYLPYWPLFILFALLSLVAAYVYLRYATPIYEASASIFIKDEKRGTQDSRMIEEFNLISSKKVVENEIEVLQSRTIMENVVKRLFLYAPLSQKGKVKESDAYIISPIIVEAQNPDSIVEVAKVDFTYDKNTQTVLLNGKDKYAINQFVSTPYGTLRFATNKYYSPSGAESSKQLSFALLSTKNVADGLTHGLKVMSARQSAIVDISFRDAIPQRAVNILNNLITIYEQQSIEEKNSLAKKTLDFVNQQLGIVGRDLDSIQKKVQQYRAGSSAVDVSSQGQLYLQNVSSNDQKLGDVNTQLAALNEVEKFVTSKGTQGGIVPSTIGVSDPMLSNLMSKLYANELEYDKLKKTVGENNPTLTTLSDEINKIRPNIIENIKSQKAGLNAAKQSLYSTNSGYNSVLQAVPQKERELLEISREEQSKNNSFQSLLQKKQEAEISLASAVSGSKVIDSALAGNDPVSPKKKLIYMIAVVGALGFCVVVITIKDIFTGKIKYRNEIEKMTSIPIIGEIAFDKSNT
ncbi:MAG: GumC family protein, partial [Ferruginibacter sp.]